MLEDWILSHGKIKETLTWLEKPANYLKYEDWTSKMKDDLENKYNMAKNNGYLLLKDPPDNVLQLEDDAPPLTSLREQDAWEIYVSWVGQGLAVEINNKVNWSVLDYDIAEIENLFHVSSFYRLFQNNHTTRYDKDGGITPGSPSFPYLFMKSQKIIKNTQLETIARLLEWCKNLMHFSGTYQAKNFEEHWLYRGSPPLTRILASTVRKKRNMRGHWTAGCHGTNAFLKYVLKTVNIPVYRKTSCDGHSLPFFPTIGKFLTHGDDPYNQLITTSYVPGEELLVDYSKFDELFPESGDPEGENVGRSTKILAEKYLPLYILHLHVEDKKLDRPPESSNVYKEVFKKFFTVNELKESKLWERMDQKIFAYGGPDKLPEKDDYLCHSWKRAYMLRKRGSWLSKFKIRTSRYKGISKTQRKPID
ncbi:MAG: hypothetical protein GF364_15370, partial [Candidatus Lokiarchaeota archaeon]|nr:hypothetical protein [Candidatus Lokiarchaeota archaeon]